MICLNVRNFQKSPKTNFVENVMYHWRIIPWFHVNRSKKLIRDTEILPNSDGSICKL